MILSRSSAGQTFFFPHLSPSPSEAPRDTSPKLHWTPMLTEQADKPSHLGILIFFRVHQIINTTSYLLEQLYIIFLLHSQLLNKSILHGVLVTSNSGQQMHLQVASGYAPSGKAGLTMSEPVLGYFHIFSCYLLISQSELQVQGPQFLSHGLASQR